MDRDVQARTPGSAVPPVERGDRVPIGLRVRGRYRIVSELGTGAFGTVCVAQDESTGHGVAIRLFPRALAGVPHAVQAVLRMGRSIISASSSHPGLVRVLEFGEVENGRPFAVMELVEGRRLSEMLSDGKPLDIAAALRLALDLGGAIETLHNMGFVHAALCPHNVMALQDGRIKLLDVELAGLRDAREMQGLITAEPSAEYLSPEQILKAPVNEKTDIYAFGAITYELLCGVPPFHGGPRDAILAKHLKESPVPILRRRPDVPGSVERAITLALYKQPEPRPLMGDILNLLWTGAHGPAPRRKRTAVVAGGAALAVAAVAAVVWGVWALRSPAPLTGLPTARPGIERAPSAPPPASAPVIETRPPLPARPSTPTVVAPPPSPAERAPLAQRAPVSPPPTATTPPAETRPAPVVRPAPPAVVAPPAARGGTPPGPPAPSAPASALPRVERRVEPRAPQAPATAAPERPTGASDPDDSRAVIDWLLNPAGRSQ